MLIRNLVSICEKLPRENSFSFSDRTILNCPISSEYSHSAPVPDAGALPDRAVYLNVTIAEKKNGFLLIEVIKEVLLQLK